MLVLGEQDGKKRVPGCSHANELPSMAGSCVTIVACGHEFNSALSAADSTHGATTKPSAHFSRGESLATHRVRAVATGMADH